MSPRRPPLYRAALAAALLALLPPGAPSSAQPAARVVDMDGGLVLVSDGRVFSRALAALNDPVRWKFVASVPADSPPVTIRHLADTPYHYFLVLSDDGEVYRYDGLNRRVERTGNLFGTVPPPRVTPKTIGGEKIEGTSKPESR
jgi:hypothetical protein